MQQLRIILQVPGNEVKINTTIINRSAYPFVLDTHFLPFGGTDTLFNKQLGIQ